MARLWRDLGFWAPGCVPPIGPVVWMSQCFCTPGRVDVTPSGSSRGTSHHLLSSPPSTLMSLGEFAKGNILVFIEVDVTQLLDLVTQNMIYTTLHGRDLLHWFYQYVCCLGSNVYLVVFFSIIFCLISNTSSILLRLTLFRFVFVSLRFSSSPQQLLVCGICLCRGTLRLTRLGGIWMRLAMRGMFR